VGPFPGKSFQVEEIALARGDRLVFYSDGITETQNPTGGEYGEERLIHTLRQHFGQDAGAMADGVLRDVARFRESRPPIDDVTLLILRGGAEVR
jgi:sigma-B regulation protein RsbU (phosphoserine phosphatase)